MGRSGSTDDRYMFLRLLGEGGTGRVTLVEDRSRPGARLALKVLNDPEGREGLLRREFAILATLHHPNLVTVHDFSLCPRSGLPRFSMEFIEGRNIVETVAQEGPESFANLAAESLYALAFLHDFGLVHRDLKPANLLIRKIPLLGRRVVMLDFGLTLRAGPDGDDASNPAGTLQYMAPELLHGSAASPRSDLYSLGAVLYEAVLGHPPVLLRNDDLSSFVEAVSEGRRPRPPLPEGYPVGFSGWFEEMLAPDPEDRPPTAREALSRLENRGGRRFLQDTAAERVARLRSGKPAERTAEIDQLWSCLDLESGPRVIWLCGEDGSGKTRILRWLEAEAVLRGWEPVRGSTMLGDRQAQSGDILSYLRRSASSKPTLLLMDEVDMTGGTAAEMLDKIARQPNRPAVQAVAACRSRQPEHPVLARLLADTGTVPTLRRVDLARLDIDRLRAMVQRATGSFSVSDAILGKLHDISGGIPVAAVSVLAAENWEEKLHAAGDIEMVRPVAPGISLLSPDALAWLEAVAVLGHGAPEQLVRSLSDLTGEKAASAAAEVAVSGLAFQEKGRWIPESTALTARVLSRIEPARRRALHLKAAEIVAGLDAPERDQWLLSRLWSGGGRLESALDAAIIAARKSRDSGDPAEAARRFNAALHLLPRNDRRRYILRMEQGVSLMSAGLYKPAARAFGAALRLSDSGAARIPALTRQAEALARAGRFGRAYQAADQALHLSSDHGDPPGAARAGKIAGIVLGRLGREEEALSTLQNALETLGPDPAPLDAAELLQAIGTCKLRLGRGDAERDLKEAIDLFRSSGRPGTELAAMVGMAVLHSRSGNHAKALELLQHVRQVASDVGNLALTETAISKMAQVYIDQGSLDRAMAMAEEAASLARHLGDRNLIFVGLCRLAEVSARCGRPGEATALMREALTGDHSGVEPENVDYARMVLADALIASGSDYLTEVESLLEVCLAGCRRRKKRRAWLMALVLEMERRVAAGSIDRIEPVLMEFEAVARGSDEPVEPEIEVRAKLARSMASLVSGNPAGAREIAVSAARTASETGVKPFEVQAHAIIAEAFSQQGLRQDEEEAINRGRICLEEAGRMISDENVRRDFESRKVFNRMRSSQDPINSSNESRLMALYGMIRALNSQSDPNLLLETILDMAINVVGAERGMILLRDHDAERFSVRVARNLEAETADDVESYSRSIVASAGSGRSMLAVDAGSDQRFRDLKSVSLYNIRSLMCVPLRSGEKIAGTVYLDSRREGAMFTKEDLRFLEAFADHAALALENVNRRKELERENRRLQEVAEQRARFGSLVGRSPGMQKVFNLIEKVAATDLPVLIQGESGTGKELVARAIHFNSDRKRKICLSENCAAIPESLLESELFGHVRGAFTGAERDRPGLFEQADGGTLFLDEVGDMPPVMQARLLRVIQEGEIRRVGGEQYLKVDVRILAATNKNLEAEAAAGQFREDLLYRLQVLTIDLPPLRDRPGDVRLLIDHFLDSISKERGREKPDIERTVEELLERYSWPGNVRELENVLHRLVLQAGSGPVSMETVASDESLRKSLLRHDAPDQATYSLASGEKVQIRRALEAAGGNRDRAASLLGISRATLYRKLKTHQIH